MNPYNRVVLLRLNPSFLNADSPSKNWLSGTIPAAASRLNHPLFDILLSSLHDDASRGAEEHREATIQTIERVCAESDDAENGDMLCQQLQWGYKQVSSTALR